MAPASPRATERRGPTLRPSAARADLVVGQVQRELLELRQPGEGGGHGLSALLASVPAGT